MIVTAAETVKYAGRHHESSQNRNPSRALAPA
jgi:hypothetical protein